MNYGDISRIISFLLVVIFFIVIFWAVFQSILRVRKAVIAGKAASDYYTDLSNVSIEETKPEKFPQINARQLEKITADFAQKGFEKLQDGTFSRSPVTIFFRLFSSAEHKTFLEIFYMPDIDHKPFFTFTTLLSDGRKLVSSTKAKPRSPATGEFLEYPLVKYYPDEKIDLVYAGHLESLNELKAKGITPADIDKEKYLEELKEKFSIAKTV
ncbi:MAG: hypothetical protein M1536_02750 [Firmicutes bacterium]|nr:hypothetical protein [Bacillota bacterium]